KGETEGFYLGPGFSHEARIRLTLFHVMVANHYEKQDTRLEARREGTAQRQDFAPHADVPEHVHRPSDSAE
ncbi:MULTISPECIES: hypothetical protein, partial [Rahnella]|uniref:hypothetical protein n=2 Tax=Yersiniaceae TaxID=1903411 RepID=UPI001E3BAB09